MKRNKEDVFEKTEEENIRKIRTAEKWTQKFG